MSIDSVESPSQVTRGHKESSSTTSSQKLDSGLVGPVPISNPRDSLLTLEIESNFSMTHHSTWDRGLHEIVSFHACADVRQRLCGIPLVYEDSYHKGCRTGKKCVPESWSPLDTEQHSTAQHLMICYLTVITRITVWESGLGCQILILGMQWMLVPILIGLWQEYATLYLCCHEGIQHQLKGMKL